MTEQEYTVKENLTFLGKCLLIVAICITVLFFVLFTYSDTILHALFNLYHITPYSYEPFDYLNMQMKLSFICATVLTIPLFLFTIYLFLKESLVFKRIVTTILVMYFLAIGGFLLGTTVLTGVILTQLSSITTITQQWSVTSILDLALILGLSIAGIFQLFVIIPFLRSIGILKKKWLSLKSRLLFYLIMLVLFAWITPDGTMLTNIILMIPLTVSTEGGLLISWFTKPTEETQNV